MKQARWKNFLGIEFTQIHPGKFSMGDAHGELDEQPVHQVSLEYAFFMATTPVTNAQYEQFDPSHKELRDKDGLSCQDSEAVLFVSWEQASAFCRWLSRKEGKPYRLPTEAEWEYACRAGTDTPFSTGLELPEEYHRNQKDVWDPEPVSLQVGVTRANSWGLFDMHGLVEEWCHDWYGPYPSRPVTNPVGHGRGDFRVTRGGSHNTNVAFLRSANRQGTLPDDANYFIGFRLVIAALPSSPPMDPPAPKLWQQIQPASEPWANHRISPDLHGPVRYVPKHEDATIPMYRHNHCPAITWCDNGDLLAIWFSCMSEAGREMTILASRLRQGASQWDMPSEFFNAPDRNMTGSGLLNDGQGTLYHFNGLEAGYGWAHLALVMRTSTDHGVSWSKPRLLNGEHQLRNQVISGCFRTQEGVLVQPCDAHFSNEGGTAVHISDDGGCTWIDPGAGQPKPLFCTGGRGAWIAGIHAGVTQLTDGRLIAFGRGNAIDGAMPMSVSQDGGKTWTYSASPFPAIGGGQRLVLMRLQEGAMLLVSFTDHSTNVRANTCTGMTMADAHGTTRHGQGMFASVSFDNGQTWPIRKLIVPGAATQTLMGGGHTGQFTLDANHAEPMGYLAATQSPDGQIHLVSSALYYRFNLSWLQAPLATVGAL